MRPELLPITMRTSLHQVHMRELSGYGILLVSFVWQRWQNIKEPLQGLSFLAWIHYFQAVLMGQSMPMTLQNRRNLEYLDLMSAANWSLLNLMPTDRSCLPVLSILMTSIHGMFKQAISFKSLLVMKALYPAWPLQKTVWWQLPGTTQSKSMQYSPESWMSRPLSMVLKWQQWQCIHLKPSSQSQQWKVRSISGKSKQAICWEFFMLRWRVDVVTSAKYHQKTTHQINIWNAWHIHLVETISSVVAKANIFMYLILDIVCSSPRYLSLVIKIFKELWKSWTRSILRMECQLTSWSCKLRIRLILIRKAKGNIFLALRRLMSLK